MFYYENSSSHTDDDGRGWTPVHRRNKNRKRSSNTVVTGSKQASGSFKATALTSDIFVGRVSLDTTISDIQEHIKNNFNIECLSVDKLNVRSNEYNCFKIKVHSNLRERLFDPNGWPTNIVVNKFFKRRTLN